MKPLFSIIVPVYNVEAYLRKCLDSVLSQTCRDWECICVDDGSPDGCGAILDAYAKLDARIKVIHQANAGVSVARNVALDMAQGGWVQFLDSDDSLELDFLEKLAVAIEKNPNVDAIEHTAIYCYDDGHRVYGDGGRLPPKCVVRSEEILRDPYGKRLTYLGRCACYKIFRRSVLERNGLRFMEGVPVGEDTFFASCFYAYADKIALCPEIAGYLRVFRPGSALLTISAESLIPQLRADEELYTIWLKHPAPGFEVTVCATIVSHLSLGKDQGHNARNKCIEEILASQFYRWRGMFFLITHGTRKAKIFAAIMIIMPRVVRKLLLYLF